MIKRSGEFPSKMEVVLIEMWESNQMSVFEIAEVVKLDPNTVYRSLQYWCGDLLEIVKPGADKQLTAPEDSTMAKKDKNKEERTKTMDKLRNGDPEYGVEMDKVRGLLPELEDGEIFLIQVQKHAKDKVTIRLGDYAV